MTVILIDSEAKSLVIETEDLSFVDQIIDIQVAIVQTILDQVDNLKVQINFEAASALEFDLEGFVVEPIVCTQESLVKWSFLIPPITSDGAAQVALDESEGHFVLE